MEATDDANPLLMGRALNADSYNMYDDIQRGEGLQQDTFCMPTPEDWCRRTAKNYSPMYGYGFADAMVVVANVFMLGFLAEAVMRGHIAGPPRRRRRAGARPGTRAHVMRRNR